MSCAERTSPARDAVAGWTYVLAEADAISLDDQPTPSARRRWRAELTWPRASGSTRLQVIPRSPSRVEQHGLLLEVNAGVLERTWRRQVRRAGRGPSPLFSSTSRHSASAVPDVQHRRGDLEGAGADHLEAEPASSAFSTLSQAAAPGATLLIRLAVEHRGRRRVGRGARTIAHRGHVTPPFGDVTETSRRGRPRRRSSSAAASPSPPTASGGGDGLRRPAGLYRARLAHGLEAPIVRTSSWLCRARHCRPGLLDGVRLVGAPRSARSPALDRSSP